MPEGIRFSTCAEILLLTAPMVFTKGNQSAFVCAVDGAGGGINQRQASRQPQLSELSPADVRLRRYLAEMALLLLYRQQNRVKRETEAKGG